MIEWLARADPQALLVGFAVVGILVALPLELAALGRLRRLRLMTGTAFLLVGAFVVLAGVTAGLVAASLHSYRRLTHEQLAANVSVRQLGDRHFAVSVATPGAPPRHFDLRGDEWQVDARVLKWSAMGTIAGFDTVYRLERLSGRYADVPSEKTAPRTVYALAPQEDFDVWPAIRRFQPWLPFADALYGSAAYVPLAENATYAVSVSTSGLVVRPANDAARKALGNWR